MYRFKAGVFCVILSAFAANVFGSSLDSAFVPFVVNVDARVTAMQDGDTVSINVEANKEDTLKIALGKNTSVTHRSKRVKQYSCNNRQP